MKIHVIRTGVFDVNSLIVPVLEKNLDSEAELSESKESKAKKCFVVDPAASVLSNDENKILDFLAKNKMECVGIVLTHSHFDHILGISVLKSAFPFAKICIHENEKNELGFACGPMNSFLLNFFGMPNVIKEIEKQPPADLLLHEGSSVFGWKVLHTPGHSPGSICLFGEEPVFSDKNPSSENQKILISGDTLFDYGGYGRTDMYGGDENLIAKSLSRLNCEIPHGTLVYPGHDSFGFSF